MKNNKSREFDFFLAVSGEAKSGEGEDAYLCLPGRGIIAVFDGCGGLGSRRYPSENGRTGAWLAARKAADTLLACASEKGGGPVVEKYEARLQMAISDYNAELNGKNGVFTVRTDMIKSLPATAAIAVIDGSSGVCDCIWAGDSRLYILDGGGLHCLNCGDDETLSADARLNNYISADGPFSFEKKKITVAGPFAVLAVTDGAYGYFATPMEFEFMLLDTLCGTLSPETWEELLTRRIAEYAGDDYTLTAAFLGYGGFDRVREAFSARREYMYEAYMKPLAESASGSSDETAARLWEQYKSGYLKDTEEKAGPA